MATTDFRKFLEDRLRSLDPGIDLSAGSPAQTQFIEPVVAYLGTDPFETDIDKFLTDRLAQEFPDIYAGDPSAIRDLFVKPLILFLEPFKRETQSVKRNQSLLRPDLLSVDDADALVANWFDERPLGGLATGMGRMYLNSPSNVPIDTSVRFYTSGGLNFFPTTPMTVTAEEMVFNREGTLYYMDVPLRAEKEGSDYNIAPDSLIGVTGLVGSVKVTNLRKFSNGADTLPTSDFVARARGALTERSLVTRPGATARLREVFANEVKAIQVIGADDEEMQRDILVGESPGHAWATGSATLYGSLALVRLRTMDAESESSPAVGDLLYIFLGKSAWPDLLQSQRFVRLKVEEVLIPYMPDTGAYLMSCLVRWSGSLPGSVLLPIPSVEGGFIRDYDLKISSLPSVGVQEPTLVVPNGDVHVFGHTDVYIRPTSPTKTNAVLTSVVDETPIVERIDLVTTAGLNTVIGETIDQQTSLSSYFDFLDEGVKPGDLLTIESGDNAGTYVVRKVTGNLPGDPSKLYLSTTLSKSGENLRYRVSSSITINPFEPRIPKLPFAAETAQDLQTQIGSSLFRFDVNTIDYGVSIGDVIRVKSGLEVGDFTIVGFDATLGGRGVYVDRISGGSAANIPYEIFTPLENVVKPLVRIKEILLLDSTKKATGISVPMADPVAVVPTSDFTTAQLKGASHLASGYVIPAMQKPTKPNLVTLPSVGANAQTRSDRRYSEGFDSVEDGIFKAMSFEDGSEAELLFPKDCFEECSYFITTVEDAPSLKNFPPIVDPRPGECLSLKSGPNKGSYLIKSVRKFRYYTGIQGNQNNPLKENWLYFIKIHGTFPVDPFLELVEFLEGNGVTVGKLDQSASVPLISFFADWYGSLGTLLMSALGNLGATPPSSTILQSAVDAMMQVQYEWGTPARGVLRSYFTQPTLLQQNTADASNPTRYVFKAASGEEIQFRPDPSLYESADILPAREDVDVDPTALPRDSIVTIDIAHPTDVQVSFSTKDKPSVFSLGVQVGDIYAVHEEAFLFDNDATDLYGKVAITAVVQTVQGSARIVVPVDTSVGPFTQSRVGDMLSIEEGDDVGMYRIIENPDKRTLVLDRPLVISTPSILLNGSSSVWGFDPTTGAPTSQKDFIQDFTVDFTGMVNKWVTLWMVPGDRLGAFWQGSYRIKTIIDVNTVEVDRGSAGHFPDPNWTVMGRCLVTDAPTSTPDAIAGVTGAGTSLVAVRPIRIYQDVPEEFPILSVVDDPSVSEVMVEGLPTEGRDQPYRIFRKNIRRVTPMEISANVEGSLYFFDTQVVSLSPSTTANLARESYLVMKEGTYESQGYRHHVTDFTLTYSMLEEGLLELPLRILPNFSADRSDNELSLVGAPLQIVYERSDAVSSVQDFLLGGAERVTAANLLARHFLPTYVSYSATYAGGSSPSIVAKDIIQYIDNLPIETAIDVSMVQNLIEKRGGNPNTPTTVTLTIHDWDRRVWAEFSQNELGGLLTKVPYHGTPRVSFYIPGPDVSGQTDKPAGERINLVKV
jgi:hypothetical protein